MAEQKRTPNEEALIEVDWVIQESYKRAVKLRGINDWTNDFPIGAHQLKRDAERDVEKYQLEIAKLISKTLIEKQRKIETEKRDKMLDERDEKFEQRMEDSDARFEKRMADKDEKIGFRKGDDDNIDDRGTGDIGKP